MPQTLMERIPWTQPKTITTRKRQKKGFIYALQHDEEMTTSFRFTNMWDTFLNKELNGIKLVKK